MSVEALYETAQYLANKRNDEVIFEATKRFEESKEIRSNGQLKYFTCCGNQGKYAADEPGFCVTAFEHCHDCQRSWAGKKYACVCPHRSPQRDIDHARGHGGYLRHLNDQQHKKDSFVREVDPIW
jgi:hypothetical protein